MNIKDIAAAANVSVSTVSKVLNHKDHDISETTKKRVLAVIKENNYSPYSNIKDVSPFKTFLVALMIDPPLIAEPFVSTLENYFARDGYSLMICPLSADGSSIKKQLNILGAKHVDGIIFYTFSEELVKLFTSANAGKIPSVYLFPTPVANHATICCNPADLSHQAVQLFIEKGHTKIGCLIDSETGDHELIKKGYLEALFEHSLTQDNALIIDSSQSSSLQVQLNSLLDSEITALYCQNLPLATTACSYFDKKSIPVPDRISVAAGEAGIISSPASPPVCLTFFPWDEICKSTAHQLISQMETRKRKIANLSIPVRISGQDFIRIPYTDIVKILVIGNIDMDTIISTDHLPRSGDLITAGSIVTAPGGKGVNQAVASSLLGGDVSIIGRVGDDIEGHAIIDTLLENNIKSDGVYIDTMCSTGKTFINSTQGEHSAVVAYPGANMHLDMQQLRDLEHLFHNIGMCLITTEIPQEIITFVINKCFESGIKIFLKPSLNTGVDSALLGKIDYLIPNAQELNQLVPDGRTVPEKAERLFQLCSNNIIVTLGDKGCYAKNSEIESYFPAANFSPVDTTGAANCFIGALAVSLGKGNTLPYSICYATYAAGFSVTQTGVQTSFPTRNQLMAYQDDIHRMYMNFLKSQRITE